MTTAGSQDPRAVVTAFNDCINRQDLDALVTLMTDDHTFVDSAGGSITGRDACREAWLDFFGSFPDYRNVFVDLRADGDAVTVVGRSECSDPALTGPAMWRATLRDGRVARWHVQDDTPDTRAALGLTGPDRA